MTVELRNLAGETIYTVDLEPNVNQQQRRKDAEDPNLLISE